MTRENKERILQAFDTLGQVQEFVGSGKGATSKCGECGHLEASTARHPEKCNTENALRQLRKLVPSFVLRSQWLAE